MVRNPESARVGLTIPSRKWQKSLSQAYESHGHFHELVGRFSLVPTSSVGGDGADGGLGVDATGVAGATFVIYERRYSHSSCLREPQSAAVLPFLTFGCSRSNFGFQSRRKHLPRNEIR